MWEARVIMERTKEKLEVNEGVKSNYEKEGREIKGKWR